MVSHIERLAAIRDKVRDIFSENAGVRTREEELAAYLSSGEIAECLAEYLLRFDDRFGELKRERALLDYNDLEHVALSLLTMPAVAEEVRKRYKYVFVDEYQDVNPVQEKFFPRWAGKTCFSSATSSSPFTASAAVSRCFCAETAGIRKGAKRLFPVPHP